MLGRLPSVLSAVGIAVATASIIAPAASAAPASTAPHGYVVQLENPPIGEYDGGTAGIPATSPRATGRTKLDVLSSAATRYRSYLAGRQAQALDRVDGPRPAVKYSYRNAFAGFAATLTPKQAKDLAKAPEVAGVWKTTNDEVSSADDDLGGNDPAFPALGGDGAAWLRLTAPSILDDPATGVPGAGLWNRIGGGPLATDGPGDGMVVGILDSGISPHNPSFASSPGATDVYLGSAFGPRPTRFTGTCDPGAESTFPGCTDKIVAARYYVTGLGAHTVHTTEVPLSPRDNDGHGSHTAGTAVGNYGVQPWTGGPRISGIAPRARIAAYKVCWQRNTNGTIRAFCNDADVVAAIDQAVADGVDALNHSITTNTGASSPKHLAFLGAYRAGVFVAASAGNGEPGSSTLTAAPAPWTTVVASNTLNRAFRGEVTLSGTSDLTVTGAAMPESLASTPIVDAAVPAPGDPAGITTGLCLAGTLDPAKVAGKVVLCARGTSLLVDKSAAVKAAGGVGMVLGNTPTTPDTTLNQAHTIPTVHVDLAAYARIKSALAAGSHQARLSPTRAGAATADGTTPRVAGDSARGPVAGVEDLPGPDVSAPGVGILAAIKGDNAFALYDGTSMATPHVAGAAALLRQRHPTWRPEQIKSALATSANPDVKATTGDARTSALDVGSGQIDPNRADDPGLVVTPSLASLEAYVDAPAARARSLNLPSIVAWNMVGRARVVRTFTSVDAASHDWTISTTAAPGTTVTTSPAVGETVSVAPGASTDVTVTVASTSNDGINVPRTGGELRLTDEDGRTVRLPITVRPTALDAPATTAIRSEGTVGTRGLTVTSGSSGDFSAVPRITGPTRSRRSLALTNGSFAMALDIPAGTPGLVAARVSNVDPAGADVDLELWQADAGGNAVAKVAESVNADSNEFVHLRVPNGGRHVLRVVSYDVPTNNGTIALETWNTSAPTGDATLSLRGTPTAPVAAGEPIELCAVARNVGEDQYLGLVSYHASADGSGPALGTTAVDVARGTPQGPCVVAPDTTVESGPTNPSPSASATFTFGADQDDVRFECRLDGAEYAACPTPHTVNGLADGSHTFEVRAVNDLFSDQTPATFTWTIDTYVPPPVPDAVIDSAPGAWTNDAAAAFVFSSPGGGDGATFECRLDDAAEFTACVSPYVPSGLQDGPHRLRVRAVNAGGADASPAEHTWTLDRVVPAAPTITGAPADVTTARTATLTWTGEPDGDFACRRGSGEWVPCASPVTYDDLPLGPHSFAVRQTDAAGNVGAEASVDWTVVAPQPPGQITPPGPLDPPVADIPPTPLGPPAAVDPAAVPSATVVLPVERVPTATRAAGRVPATIGTRGRTIPVGCRVDRGSLTRCTVVARYRGRIVGRGAARFKDVRSGEVAVRLTAKGLAAIRRLGGARLRFTVTVTAGGKKLAATRSAKVLPTRAIVIPAGGLFASDSSRLTAAGRRLVARVRRDLAGAKRLTCVGHTDARGSARVNERVGLDRATAVCAALRGRNVRIPVRSTSEGETRPRATNRTPAGRALNRRVEIVVAYRCRTVRRRCSDRGVELCRCGVARRRLRHRALDRVDVANRAGVGRGRHRRVGP